MVSNDFLSARRIALFAVLVLVLPAVLSTATHFAGASSTPADAGGDAGTQRSENDTATPEQRRTETPADDDPDTATPTADSQQTATAVPTERGAGYSVDGLTIVSATQDTDVDPYGPVGLEIIDTETKERVWHSDLKCNRYYDVDPVDNATILTTAKCQLSNGRESTLAMEINWRTDEVVRAFHVPGDVHDVDRLNEHEYVVADIINERAYVYNYTADGHWWGPDWKHATIKNSVKQDHAWEYNFTERFRPPPANGGGRHGFTHLNDVDPIDGGDAFLLSPRNFNRVIAVDRETKETRWTLGEQNDTSILNRQHHPVLVDDDPATVLVGDSENNRVVEYTRRDGRWEITWGYNTGLNWPRAVERLPNGNTLIVDTGNDRVIEVAPDGSVVWEYETTPNPYDVERYALGDEPVKPDPVTPTATGGDATATATPTDAAESATPSPTAATTATESQTPVEVAPASVSPVDRYHRYAGFVAPWLGKWEFVALLGSVAVALGWLTTEVALVLKQRV